MTEQEFQNFISQEGEYEKLCGSIERALKIAEIVCGYHPWEFGGIKSIGSEHITIGVSKWDGCYCHGSTQYDIIDFPIRYLLMDDNAIHSEEERNKAKREADEKKCKEDEQRRDAQRREAADRAQLAALKLKYE